MNITADVTLEEQERVIDLEARMRGVTKQQIRDLIESKIEYNSFNSPIKNNNNIADIEEENGKLYPSRNVSNSDPVDDQKLSQKKRRNRKSSNITPPLKKKFSTIKTNDPTNSKKITEFLQNNPAANKKNNLHTHNQKNKSKSPQQPISQEINSAYEGLQMQYQTNQQLLAEKNNEISILEIKIQELKEIEKELREQLNIQGDRVLKSQESIKAIILENEKLKKNELRLQIAQQKQRLGEYTVQREGTKMNEIWVDGYELREIKQKLKQIENLKEELEKKKKNNKGKTDETLTLQLKLQLLAKDEQGLTEQLERLEQEKVIFIRQLKRLFEEEHSRFGKAAFWPVIGERYQLLSLLGKGGFSEVYKAYDLIEQREVACKIHQLNPNWSEMSKQNYIKHAIRENRVHRELSHPNIVKLYDSVEMDQNSFCTVLEYCDGPDLQFYLKKYKQFPEKEAKLIIIQILSAIKYLNSYKNKVIHYDLKPQNILFHKNEVKVSDFGLCKVLENEETRLELTSQGVGTYWYLPPECFQTGDNPPNISSKVDVWSIGVIFYEMLFGTKPFGQGYSQEKILKDQIILNANAVQFPTKPVVSNECKEFIKGSLCHKQLERYDVNEAWANPYIQQTFTNISKK